MGQRGTPAGRGYPAAADLPPDILREPQRDGLWVCRRDETIALPYDQIIRHDKAGIPYLAPHIVLLLKAKAAQAKD